MHRPSRGQALWQDLWELGHQEQITVYRVTRRAPLAAPGDDEADPLAKERRLKMVPASPSGAEVARWLHCCLVLVGQKTTGSAIEAWGSPVTLEVQEAWGPCVVCSQEHP